MFTGANKNVHGDIIRALINANSIHASVIVGAIYSMCILLSPVELAAGVILLLSIYANKAKRFF